MSANCGATIAKFLNHLLKDLKCDRASATLTVGPEADLIVEAYCPSFYCFRTVY